MESMEMTFWSGKSVLVTGATGLVGSWLVQELLSQKANVACLVWDSDPTSELISSKLIDRTLVINGDLADIAACEKAITTSNCEYVFHLGAQTIVGEALQDPVRTFRSNIQGTWNLLEAIRNSKSSIKSVVVASSDKAYGTANTLPYKEDFPLHGDGPYDVSKTCTDLLAQSYATTFGLPITVARCGNIYGGGDLNWSRIVPGTIKSLLMEETPILRSDGTFIRDYVHVDDIVGAYLFLAEQTETKNIQGEAYNFSRDEPLSVLDVYREVCSVVVGKYVEPKILSTTTAEIKDQHLDSSKARKELGWKSTVTLEKGITKTYDWYLNYFKDKK
jgi:CDP-glucose 4,6-dehydratase